MILISLFVSIIRLISLFITAIVRLLVFALMILCNPLLLLIIIGVVTYYHFKH